MANPIEDFRIIGSLGFTNVAAKTWKIIFSMYSLSEFNQLVKSGKSEELGLALSRLSGIGKSTVDTILTEYRHFESDIEYIIQKFNVMDSKYITYGKQIRFTGCRDKILEDKLKSLGHDADGNAGVTKKTDILIIPYEGFSSTKLNKVTDDCIVVTLGEFNQNMEKYL